MLGRSSFRRLIVALLGSLAARASASSISSGCWCLSSNQVQQHEQSRNDDYGHKDFDRQANPCFAGQTGLNVLPPLIGKPFRSWLS